jgi:hypothetical protein
MMARDIAVLGVTARDTAVLGVTTRDSGAREVTALDATALDVTALDVTAHLGPALGAAPADTATWAVVTRPASHRSSGPVATRSAGLPGRAGPMRSGSAARLGLIARVPWPRRAPRAESYGDPVPDWVDQDATTTDLPVIAAPPDAPVLSTVRARDAWADDPGAGAAWATETWVTDPAAGRARVHEAASTSGATGSAASSTASGSAANGGATGGGAANGGATGGGAANGGATGRGAASGGGDELVRDLPVRRPGSRSGHGQSRRVTGSHRAARARPPQHSGR